MKLMHMRVHMPCAKTRQNRHFRERENGSGFGRTFVRIGNGTRLKLRSGGLETVSRQQRRTAARRFRHDRHFTAQRQGRRRRMADIEGPDRRPSVVRGSSRQERRSKQADNDSSKHDNSPAFHALQYKKIEREVNIKFKFDAGLFRPAGRKRVSRLRAW